MYSYLLVGTTERKRGLMPDTVHGTTKTDHTTREALTSSRSFIYIHFSAETGNSQSYCKGHVLIEYLASAWMISIEDRLFTGRWNADVSQHGSIRSLPGGKSTAQR